MHWGSFLIGFAAAFGLSTCFMLFCVRFAKRHPLMSKEPEETILAAETTVTFGHGLRVVK